MRSHLAFDAEHGWQTFCLEVEYRDVFMAAAKPPQQADPANEVSHPDAINILGHQKRYSRQVQP